MEFDYTCQPGLKDWALDYVKTGKPLVSIITPYYNSSRHIMQTVRCVLNQTFPYFEWILVDDGSTEAGVRELLAEIENLDPRIHVLFKENGGPAAARNYGVHHAAGGCWKRSPALRGHIPEALDLAVRNIFGTSPLTPSV